MHQYTYIRPHTIQEAVALLSDPTITSRILAGGTDLLVALRSEPPDFERVIDVSQIADLHTITIRAGQLHIGAGVTFRMAANSPLIQQHAPLLATACRSIGTMQIANMATLGGNTANAAAAADTVPTLICLEATALIATPQGTQRLPVADLVIGPNRNALARDALITAFVCPLLPEHTHTIFLKVGRRNALSIARLSLAALGRLSPAGRIAEVRLVAGACFPRPRRAYEVETLLCGQHPSPALFNEAGHLLARLMVAATGQRWSTAYKSLALVDLVCEALEHVLPGTTDESGTTNESKNTTDKPG